jgi:hypothetical protein
MDVNKVATTDPTNKGDALLEALQGKLLDSASVISSEDTNIEKAIGKSIESLKVGNEASKKRIESEYKRELGYANDQFANDVNNERDSGRGFAVNVGALREITKTGDKRIADLQMRKEELMLAGDANTAKEISNLQLQELQFQQQARQQTFTNLLGMANFGVSMRTEDRLAKSQSFAEKSAISNIALQYGLKLNEGDTLETITARAMPFASEKQRLEISKMKAEINKANAEATKALRGDETAKIDGTTASILATAFRRGNTDFLATIKNLDDAGKIYDEVIKQGDADKQAAAALAQKIRNSGGNVAQFTKMIKEDPNIIIDDTTAATIAKEIFVKNKTTNNGNVLDKFSNWFGETILQEPPRR